MAIKLAGKILDPYGNPVPKAEIKFQSQTNNSRVLQHAHSSVVADTAGDYTISVEVGTYTISVKYQQGGSFRVIAKDIRVDSGVTATDLNSLLMDSKHESEATPDVVLTLQSIKSAVDAMEQSAAKSAVAASNSETGAKSSAAAAKSSQDAAATSATAAASSQSISSQLLTETSGKADAASASEKTATSASKSASDSEASARQHREASALSATAAAHSEASSFQYQENAKASALAAANSQTAAKSSEDTASQQALASSTSAAESKASMEESNSSRDTTNIAKDTALAAKDAAATSASAAKISETQAATSSATAKEAEKNAYESSKNAKASESASALSESNAKASELAAKTSETSVANNRQEVLEKTEQVRADRDSVAANRESVDKTKVSIDTSERNTAASSVSASDSAARSAASAIASNNYAAQSKSVHLDTQKLTSLATVSENNARAWASNPHGTPVVDDKYSALHWAEEARAFTQGSMKYRGEWTFPDGKYPSSPTNGSFWQVTVKATVDGVSYEAGDSLSYMEDPDTGSTKFFRVSGANAVTSVAGRKGDVVLSKSDISDIDKVRNVESYSKVETDTGFVGQEAFSEFRSTLGTAATGDLDSLSTKENLASLDKSLSKAAKSGALEDTTGNLLFSRLTEVPGWILQTHEDDRKLYMRAADGTQYRLGGGTLDFFNAEGDTVFSVDSKGLIQTGNMPAYHLTGIVPVANGGTGRDDGTAQFSSVYLNGAALDAGVFFNANGSTKITAGEDTEDLDKTGNLTVDTWNTFAIRSTFQSWQTTFKHCARTGHTNMRGDLHLFGGNERTVSNESNALWLQGENTKVRIGYGTLDYYRPNGDKVLSVDGSSTISLMMNENAYLKNASGNMAMQSNDGTALWVQNEDVISTRNSAGATTFRIAKGIMTDGVVPEGRISGVVPMSKGGTGRTDGTLSATTVYADTYEFRSNVKISQGDDNGDNLDQSANINVDTWWGFAIRSTINNYQTMFKVDARAGDVYLRGSIYNPKAEFSVKSSKAVHITGGNTRMRVGYNNVDFHRENGDKVLNIGPNGELNIGKGQGVVRSMEGRVGLICSYGDELWVDGANTLAFHTAQGENTLRFEAGKMTVGKIPMARLVDMGYNTIGAVYTQVCAGDFVTRNNIYRARPAKAWELTAWYGTEGITGTWTVTSVNWSSTINAAVVTFQKTSESI